jgi:hypothetical protein
LFSLCALQGRIGRKILAGVPPTFDAPIAEVYEGWMVPLLFAVDRKNQMHGSRTRIELARREETLIAQNGANERRRASDGAEAAHIASVSQAESTSLLEAARNDAEKTRMAIYRDLPIDALIGLAANELAGKLQTIEHVSLTPDLLGDLVQKLLQKKAA